MFLRNNASVHCQNINIINDMMIQQCQNKSFALLPINDDYCKEKICEKGDGIYLNVIDRKLAQSICHYAEAQ